jgi:SAM-dependent methyltransferase
MARVLTADQAKAFYDRFGARQDGQAFYEDPAADRLVAHADFAEAGAVFEFGCGTGRFAARLLADHLAAGCTYSGVDLSPTMVGLARARLEPWGGRARVRPSDGAMTVDAAGAAFDRFVCAYVLDLLGPGDIRRLLAEAHRVLAPGGLLCIIGLTFGATWPARLVTIAWCLVHRLRPRLVGGCRPIRVADYLEAASWEIRHHGVVTGYAISSEVLVAARR